jgi:hypothetical protein
MSILQALADRRLLAAVAALATVGIGLALVAPSVVAAAIPLLIVAACPLSMVVMMRMMAGHEPSPSSRAEASSRDPGSLLRDRLAATRREEQRLEEELARLETADRAATAEASSSSA